jgi:hypothetical protein
MIRQGVGCPLMPPIGAMKTYRPYLLSMGHQAAGVTSITAP